MSTLIVYMYLAFSQCYAMLSLSGIIYISEERIYNRCMYIHILDPQVWRHCCRSGGLVWHEQVKLTWVSKAGAVPRVLHPKYRPEVLFVLCVCLSCCEGSVFQKMSWCAYGCCVVSPRFSCVSACHVWTCPDLLFLEITACIAYIHQNHTCAWWRVLLALRLFLYPHTHTCIQNQISILSMFAHFYVFLVYLFIFIQLFVNYHIMN